MGEKLIHHTGHTGRTTTSSRPRLAYQTEAGKLFLGPAEKLLRHRLLAPARKQVQLVFTSPPFPLHRQKKYGNRIGDEFAEWLAGFAQPLTDMLTPDGSIVLEIGNGWNPGTPTVSTAGIKALLAFQEAAGLHLCQEFICFNPARLPTPAEWVTVRRTRVKDSFTRVWWLSPVPHPKADNRRVLTEYSDAMRKLLKKGTYTGGRRPSEHRIGEKSFLTDNGGAIPANVLVPPESEQVVEPEAILSIPNTTNNSAYHRRCRERGVTRHPAAMPEALVRFFVQFLTDPGDLVLDPFAGSNTTGAVAEELGRKWIGLEADAGYAELSQIRFEQATPAA